MRRRRFIFFDQNIRKVGGHFLELATVILDAAERMGFEPWLVTHRDFGASSILNGSEAVLARESNSNPKPSGLFESPSPGFQLPEELQGRDWQIRPQMPYWKMHRWALNVDGNSRVARDPDGNPQGSGLRILWQNFVDRIHGTRPQVMLRQHADAIVQVFKEVQPTSDDVVLFGTCDEFSGLAIPLALKVASLQEAIDIHLLFHSNFIAKRQGDWVTRPCVQNELKLQLHQIISGAKPHRIHCWATTAELRDQLNLLTMSRQFSGIDYPIRRNANITQPSLGKPLRLLLGGAIRTEKGSKQISGLLEQLWESQLKPGHWQVAMQVSSRSATTIFPRHLRSKITFDDQDDHQVPLLLMVDKLRAGEYQRFIASANAGLFLYDAQRYYARCSGVLVEMLASGIPVVVPAGCWLSRQIAPSIAQHCSQQQILRELYNCVGLKSITSRPTKGNSISFTVSHGNVEKTIAAAGVLSVDAHLSSPKADMSIVCEVIIDQSRDDDYVGFELNQRDIHGIVISAQRQYCEVFTEKPVRTIFQLSSQCTQASLCLFAPFRQRTMKMRSLRVCQLDGSEDGCAPTASVGLIAATNREIPRLIDELTRHYEHYRQSAIENSSQWQQRHCGESLVETLLGSQNPNSV